MSDRATDRVRETEVRKTFAALLAAGLVLLAGCMDSGGGSSVSVGSRTSPSTGSTTTAAGVGNLRAYYHQTIHWKACGKDRCGSLSVPVDYHHPSAASTKLAVEVAPATSGKAIGSLVVNPGGPGAPGVDLASDASSYFAAPLRAAYDIVGFDPRGTGRSNPVDCLTDHQLDQFVAEDPDPSTPAEVKQFSASAKEFWHGCEKRSDSLVDHVSTVDAARDMDILRAALKQSKMDYFGFSYGTKLGATYADLFPRKVGRMVLDGAMDVRLSTRESALHQAAGFQTALTSYVKHCVSGDHCFLGSTVQQGLHRISALLDSIAKKPLPTQSGRKLTVGNAFYGVVAPLYSRGMWQYLDIGLKQAIQGNGSVLLSLSDAYTMRGQNGGYTDNSMEAISVISCLDDPWSLPPSKIPGQYAAFEKASPTFGRVFAWGLAACWGDPMRNTDDPHLKIDAAGAAPIVVIGTTRDPATPYEEAVALSRELKSGVLVTRNGDGHTAYNEGNSCIDDAVHSYLIHGKVPKNGLRC